MERTHNLPCPVLSASSCGKGGKPPQRRVGIQLCRKRFVKCGQRPSQAQKKRTPVSPAWIDPSLANRRGEEPQSQENALFVCSDGQDFRLPQKRTASTFSGPERTIGSAFLAVI